MTHPNTRLSLHDSTTHSACPECGAGTSAVPDQRAVRGTPVTLLLVEDNADNLLLLAEALEMLDYVVCPAASGEEGLARLRQVHPQVILCDIGLPGMDGYEFMRRVRQMPEAADVVAIALTGYGQAEDVRMAREAGYTRHLLKPIEVQALDACIREALAANSAS